MTHILKDEKEFFKILTTEDWIYVTALALVAFSFSRHLQVHRRAPSNPTPSSLPLLTPSEFNFRGSPVDTDSFSTSLLRPLLPLKIATVRGWNNTVRKTGRSLPPQWQFGVWKQTLNTGGWCECTGEQLICHLRCSEISGFKSIM